MNQDKLMKIFGTDELVKMFEDMDREIQTNILQTSFKKASLLIISEAQNNLKGTYKHVSAAIGASMDKSTQTLNVGSIKRKGGYLAHIVNSGTKERSYKSKKGKMHRTGKIIGNNFWDDALASTESSVEETIYNDIVDKFNKLIQKRNNLK